MVLIEVPDALAQEYEALARTSGQDRDALIRENLIAQLEDLEDIEIATERLKNPQPSLSLEEVKRNLGLDD